MIMLCVLCTGLDGHMTKDDLEKRLRSIELEAANAKNQAVHDYCMAHNTVEIGDIFTDHIGSIRVERITVAASFASSQFCCVYHGPELTKTLEPKKRSKQRSAYQCNAKPAH